MRKSFEFRVTIPRGTPLNDDSRPQLLVAEETIPFWGELISYDATVLRNGSVALDVSTYSVGVTSSQGKQRLKFQLWDTSVPTVVDCEYVVYASFYFEP